MQVALTLQPGSFFDETVVATYLIFKDYEWLWVIRSDLMTIQKANLSGKSITPCLSIREKKTTMIAWGVSLDVNKTLNSEIFDDIKPHDGATIPFLLISLANKHSIFILPYCMATQKMMFKIDKIFHKLQCIIGSLITSLIYYTRTPYLESSSDSRF